MLLSKRISCRRWLIVAGVFLASAPIGRLHADDSAANQCQTHGTTIQWFADPQAAAERAKQQSKLLFVIHLSGNFAKQEFT